jgi:hypothetical protein
MAVRTFWLEQPLEAPMARESDDIEKNETHELIASDKVEGTAVYSYSSEKLGVIRNFMVNKLSGEVEYAVLQFGGFLGIGEDYYPLPWDALTYDTDLKGYVVNIDKSILQDAPHYSSEEPVFDRDYGRRIYGAYGLEYPY